MAVLTGGDMTITDLLQVRTYAEEAYTQYQLGNPGRAAAVALPPLVILGGLILAGVAILLRVDPARVGLGIESGRATGRSVGGGFPLGLVVIATAGNLIALPVYSLIWRAGRVGGRAALEEAPRWSLGGLFGDAPARGGGTARPWPGATLPKPDAIEPDPGGTLGGPGGRAGLGLGLPGAAVGRVADLDGPWW